MPSDISTKRLSFHSSGLRGSFRRFEPLARDPQAYPRYPNQPAVDAAAPDDAEPSVLLTPSQRMRQRRLAFGPQPTRARLVLEDESRIG